MTSRAKNTRGESVSDVVYIIDSREQAPYSFPKSKVAMLKTGDYSTLGMETIAVVERKSLQDALQSVGKGRDRFERELKRMAEFEFAAIVIESSVRRP